MSFDSLESHLDYEQHEVKTSQESIYDNFRRDWAARFSTIHSENRPKRKVHISSVANSSLPMGWVLKKPRVGRKIYSPHVKDYLKARFDAGPENNLDRKPTHTAGFNGHAKCSNRREQTSILERGMANKKPGAIILSEALCFKTKTSKRASL